MGTERPLGRLLASCACLVSRHYSMTGLPDGQHELRCLGSQSSKVQSYQAMVLSIMKQMNESQSAAKETCIGQLACSKM